MSNLYPDDNLHNMTHSEILTVLDSLSKKMGSNLTRIDGTLESGKNKNKLKKKNRKIKKLKKKNREFRKEKANKSDLLEWSQIIFPSLISTTPKILDVILRDRQRTLVPKNKKNDDSNI